MKSASSPNRVIFDIRKSPTGVRMLSRKYKKDIGFPFFHFIYFTIIPCLRSSVKFYFKTNFTAFYKVIAKYDCFYPKSMV